MNDFLSVFIPRNQNKTQKAGFITSISLVMLTIFLHFPFNGYDNEHYVVTRHGYGPCAPEITMDELYKLTSEELDERYKMTKRCTDDVELRLKSFTDWRSYSAIVPWLASPFNTIISIIFSLIFGIVWISMFRDKNDTINSTFD